MNVAAVSFLERLRLTSISARPLNAQIINNPTEFIRVLEETLATHPNEWIVHWNLADKYGEIGRYEEAVKASQRCVELKPNDIRSTYALASGYYLLTRVDWTNEESEAYKAMLAANPNVPDVSPDRLRFEHALQELGLDAQTAAVQAIRWFEKSLTLRPDSQSRAFIQHHLEALYQRYPKLRD